MQMGKEYNHQLNVTTNSHLRHLAYRKKLDHSLIPSTKGEYPEIIIPLLAPNHLYTDTRYTAFLCYRKVGI